MFVCVWKGVGVGVGLVHENLERCRTDVQRRPRDQTWILQRSMQHLVVEGGVMEINKIYDKRNPDITRGI